jgi:hypothetical protein
VVAARTVAIIGLVLALRLPFLNQPIQGDDLYYLYGAEHAQIDPLDPNHARYLFQGDMVDMRGHPHPPLNAWILAGLLAVLGDVREAPFHLAYSVFSVIAALAMWALARRLCERPFLATLLFLAVPAFVVNGNSLEADLPFLALWMAAIALFVRAVDRESAAALAGCCFTAALAGLAAYQAIFLAPVLAVYLWQRRRAWTQGWAAVLAAPAALAAWQLWERASSGALPATVLAGYMQTYGLEVWTQKVRNAGALVVHAGWIVSPVAAVAFVKGKWQVAAAAVAACGAGVYDPNPLFWVSIGCGVLLLSWLLAQRDFLAGWALIFFAGAVVVFFAGSARYLLPVAAPVAILVARVAGEKLLWAAFALQMTLALALATANYQHWDGYRSFAASLKDAAGAKRIWTSAEWGLRYYLESEGALPIARDQAFQPGELLVTTELNRGPVVRAQLAPLTKTAITPWIPLRLISVSGRSAYSSAARGLLPFEISREPADWVLAEEVLERKAELSYLDPQDPRAAAQILSGLYPDGWMGAQASVLLKAPEASAPLRVEIYIPPAAPARRVRMAVGGEVVAEETFPQHGAFALAAPFSTDAASVTVTLTVDQTYFAPPDQRKLGIVVRGIGFR